MLEDPKLLEFEDDIIEILISTVTLSRSLSRNLSRVVYLFPNIANKFQNKAAQLYIAYNTLLIHGKEVFKDPVVITNMIEIALRAMHRAEDNSREFEDVFMTEGVMILHLAIQVQDY